MSALGEAEFSRLWAPSPETALEVLGKPLTAENSTGFDLRGFPASTWLIHAMYERPMQSPLSHDEREKQQIAAGKLLPAVVNEVDLSARTTTTGVGLGWSKAPGAPYTRLRWKDYAERMSVPVLRDGHWPGINGLIPSPAGPGSWPENVEPPTEGSIDEESWIELVRVLGSHSREGGQTRCTAFHTPWALWPDDAPFLFSGALADGSALIENPFTMGSPQNFWPDGLEWFVYTDYDFQASRISGSADLIAALLANPVLDCEQLPGWPSSGLKRAPAKLRWSRQLWLARNAEVVFLLGRRAGFSDLKNTFWDNEGTKHDPDDEDSKDWANSEPDPNAP